MDRQLAVVLVLAIPVVTIASTAGIARLTRRRPADRAARTLKAVGIGALVLFGLAGAAGLGCIAFALLIV